jgi:hypothetical protein
MGLPSDMSTTSSKLDNVTKMKLGFIALTMLAVGLAAVPLSSQENASNPLAAVNNTDLRVQYFDLGGSDLVELWVDGAYMIIPQLKFKYELHYSITDVTGSWQNGFESLRLKPIWFPTQGVWGSWNYRLAIGLEWIVEFGNESKGIGSGSDQLAPLVGLALANGGTVLIPLVQQFLSYNGPTVNTTAFRLIAIQSIPNNFWGKLDAIIPVEWANDNSVPATIEVQLGKMFEPWFGIYLDGLFGIGKDRPYDWGVGFGTRFNY